MTTSDATPRARSRRRRGLGLLALVILLVLAVLLSLAVGANPLSPGLVVDTLSAGAAPTRRGTS